MEATASPLAPPTDTGVGPTPRRASSPSSRPSPTLPATDGADGSDAGRPPPVLPLTVVASDVMTDAAVMAADGDNRTVREVRLLGPSGGDTPAYAPGDVVHLLVRNRPAAVAAFLRLTGLSPAATVRVTAVGGGGDGAGNGVHDGAAAVRLNTANPTTVAELAAAHLDLTATPTRLFFARLAPYATDATAAERLRFFASPAGAGAAARRQYAVAEARTLLMVFRDFPSARPPLAALLRFSGEGDQDEACGGLLASGGEAALSDIASRRRRVLGGRRRRVFRDQRQHVFGRRRQRVSGSRQLLLSRR